jgi:hypothetical protein
MQTTDQWNNSDRGRRNAVYDKHRTASSDGDLMNRPRRRFTSSEASSKAWLFLPLLASLPEIEVGYDRDSRDEAWSETASVLNREGFEMRKTWWS